VNKIYSEFEEAFIQTVDKHAPVKQRKPCQNPAPFINKEYVMYITNTTVIIAGIHTITWFVSKYDII
jgi:hypothetical protein